MNATEQAAIITLLCNIIAEHLETNELAQLATILTQLGATMGFIAAQKALEQESSESNNTNNVCNSNRTNGSSTATGSTAASVSTEGIEGSLAGNT